LIKKPPVNNRIRAREVRLIDEAGKQLGVVKLEDALRISLERNLDLVQVTEKLDPPVCKIMEYGKYLYSLQKKEHEGRQKKSGEVKGIRLTFNISQHDLETRARQAEKFLNKGNKIRIELRLRGRERALKDVAKEKVNKFIEILNGLILVRIEREFKAEPRGLTMIISKDTKEQKNA